MMGQSAFAAALLNPQANLPEGLIDPKGRPAPKRFAVYQNNVASSLTRALEGNFPVIRKLVGDEFFAGMALIYLRAHPPQSRQIMLYGQDMPDFLETFQPVAHLGYLPDIARLEQAIRESYHGADSAAVPPEALATLSEAQFLQSCLMLAPSLRLIRSVWPIHAIWLANAKDGPAPQMRGEEVVVLRPEFDPAPQLLPSGGGAFVQALLDGGTLESALSIAGDDFDLARVLGLLFQGQAIVKVIT